MTATPESYMSLLVLTGLELISNLNSCFFIYSLIFGGSYIRE
jgi:hypothetical protein